MNKHILFVMRNLDNPELFTQEEKEVNRKSAHTTYSAAVAAYAAAADAEAAEWVAYSTAVAEAAEWVADAAANAAYAAADAAYAATDAAYAATVAAAYAADVEHWVNKFFERSGEDKQTYIDEINKMLGE